MSESENLLREPPAGPTPARPDAAEAPVDLNSALTWLKAHQVLVGGLLLIVAEVIWKGQFLSHMYLRRDDFVNQDIALTSPLNWHYLSQVSDGHLSPGLRGITWVLVRISLYNWGLDAGVALAFVAAASLAAFRLLRTLFGNRPAILIPLAIYALTPLTVPDLGWWWGALESLPFQLAMFMALNAHVLYVRTGRWQHLAAASAWLVFSMLFFEKAMILPPLLFAVTAGFLMETRSWLGGAVLTVKRHWKGWLTYLALMAGYMIVFLFAFQNSTARPHLPTVATTWAFAWSLLKNSMLTGAAGLQWGWLTLSDRLYAIVAPSAAAIALSALILLSVIAASVVIRARAWRAWAILLGWVIFADMVPILLGRVSLGRLPYYASLFGLQSRYVAEAACVLALCVGLAFLPVTGTAPRTVRQGSRRRVAAASQSHRHVLSADRGLRYAGAAVVAVFVVGSIGSVRTYEKATSSGPVRSYVTNVEQALKLTPAGTKVLDQNMPLWILGPYFGKHNLESYVIGTLAKNRGRDTLQWVTGPRGTADGLRIFGNDGRLYPATISGVSSVHRKATGFKGCWPEKNGQIVVWFSKPTTVNDWTLELSYIWGSGPSSVLVEYNGTEQSLSVQHGVHDGYLPVSGLVSSFIVSGLGNNHLCIGSASAGHIVPF